MNINKLCIDTIKVLSNQAINKANSGHPGMVLSSAAISHCLYSDFLTITPKNPTWLNRDRFVLASGHASMLLYSNLHFLGYKISMDDIKNFRQLGSITPGHPEVDTSHGIDSTSGPLGQGIGHAVGMAMAEKFLAEQFNKEDITLFDNYTYCLCGDGDIEEGASYESMSIASRLNLNKLIIIYDCNDVTLDGPLSYSLNEDVKKRCLAMNFNVLEVDGLDYEKVKQAIKKAHKFTTKPTIIIAHTIMGVGSSNQGTCLVHGSPIKEDIENLKNSLDYHYDNFEVNPKVYEYYHQVANRNTRKYNKWVKLLNLYKAKYPKDFEQLNKGINRDFKDIVYPNIDLSTNEATRASFGKTINAISSQIKVLLGGSSDVARSVNTFLKDEKIFGLEENGKNVYYGIREFGMSLAQSGMLLYGGVRPYVGCFLVFSDYLKPSIRTAALMKLPSINVLTHDSIAVGEDGPTHQPIEQVNSLRLIPSTYTIRPSGALETQYSVKFALENKQNPVNLILSRQAMGIPCDISYEDFMKGAYIASKESSEKFITIIATGSEVELAIKTKESLKDKVDVRVVSMPCVELFEKNSEKFKKELIKNRKSNVFVLEMGTEALWYKYADNVYGINRFGASGKDKDVLAAYGFSVSAVERFILSKLH